MTKALHDDDRVAEEVYQLTRTMYGLYLEMRGAPEQLTPDAAADFVEAAVRLVMVLRAVPQRGE